MIKTKWKANAELEYSLRNFNKVTILSCGFCASFCDTGGTIGIKVMKDFLQHRGKRVISADVVPSCCSEVVMKEAVKMHQSVLSVSDALVVLSCSAGVKSAYMAGVSIPIVGALDTIGNTPITRQTGLVAESTCETCGQCVLTYTGGVCPISQCPLHMKYGPCEQFSKTGSKCAVDPSKDCVWSTIARTGDLEELSKLRVLHESSVGAVANTPVGSRPPTWLRNISGWYMAHSGWMEKIALSIR